MQIFPGNDKDNDNSDPSLLSLRKTIDVLISNDDKWNYIVTFHMRYFCSRVNSLSLHVYSQVGIYDIFWMAWLSIFRPKTIIPITNIVIGRGDCSPLCYLWSSIGSLIKRNKNSGRMKHHGASMSRFYWLSNHSLVWNKETNGSRWEQNVPTKSSN